MKNLYLLPTNSLHIVYNFICPSSFVWTTLDKYRYRFSGCSVTQKTFFIFSLINCTESFSAKSSLPTHAYYITIYSCDHFNIDHISSSTMRNFQSLVFSIQMCDLTVFSRYLFKIFCKKLIQTNWITYKWVQPMNYILPKIQR